jgi:cell division protein FtsB
MKTYKFMIKSRLSFLRTRSVCDKRRSENQTHNLLSLTFSRKPCRLRDNVEKYDRARQTIEDNITRLRKHN